MARTPSSALSSSSPKLIRREADVKRNRLALPVAVALLALPAMHVFAEDLLWRAYADGRPEKRALLGECQERMARIRGRASAALEEPDWNRDTDVQWLLSHRTPATLALEREFHRKYSGYQLEALAHMTVALGGRRLTKRLPGLLRAATSTRSRLRVLQVMADLRDEECLAALEQFVMRADWGTPEELICEAARGLSLTRDRKYRVALVRARALVESEAAGVRLAAARYRCGEPVMAGYVLDVLKQKDADPALQLFALDFFMENPDQEAVPTLAALAAANPDERVAARAFEALMHTTGYGVPPAEIPAYPSDAPPADEAAEEGPPSGHALPEAVEPRTQTREQRKREVRSILRWWEEHPGVRPQARRPKTREEALAATDAASPH